MSQAAVSAAFVSGRSRRIKTEMNGNTQPIANQRQNERPIFFARKADVSGTQKRMEPKNARRGITKRFEQT